MPRTVDLTVPPEHTDELVQRLQDHDDVLSLRLLRGASLSPAGDVLSFEVLDSSLAWAMRLADGVGLGNDPAVSLTSSRPESVTSAGSAPLVDRDRSTSSWEEVQLTIGRESTMTPAKLLVMFLAGIFAAVGLHTGALHVIIGAMLVAPAYEPLARVALGFVNRSRSVRDGLVDFAFAYAALAVGAATVAALARLQGEPLSPQADTYLGSAAFVTYWTTVNWTSFVVAAAGGVGGGLLIVANRRVLTTGIVIALAFVPSLSLAVLELSLGEPELAARAVLRWSVDVVLVVACCSGVFFVKRRVDRRLIAGCNNPNALP